MMRLRARSAVALVLFVLSVSTRVAAGQSAVVEGRVVDDESAAVANAMVTLTSRSRGLKRTAVTDREGLYRFAGLPVDTYDISVASSGFATVERQNIVLDVGGIVRVDVRLPIAPLQQTVVVTAERSRVGIPLPEVGGVVDSRRIASLPLNGRQFANLAGTLPGIGVDFHHDPTKNTQYTPQIAGGTGRNVNYLVDGGDNNDDTVGGLLQLFPLDSIEEFRLSVAGYSAEYGRSSGGVMHVVTKSGTNRFAGGAFSFFRDDAMNALATTEARNGVPKPDYRRWQYGGSFGGPIVRDEVHFFAAVERVQQDTFQVVDTAGLFPELDGIFPVPYRESLLVGKATWTASVRDRASARYGWNATAQPADVAPRVPPEAWGDSRNRFHSINTGYTRVLRDTGLAEVLIQYSTFLNTISSQTTGSTETFPNGVVVGRDPSAPQATEQRKLQIAASFAWHAGGLGGLGHDFKTGLALIDEPRLGLAATPPEAGAFVYEHSTNDRQGPLFRIFGDSGVPALQIPMSQLGVYLQDDWRVSNRVSLNLGLRYDLMLGFEFDQSRNPNFLVLQEAARQGRFAGVIGFEDFGKTPRDDFDNVQPRIGFTLDVSGDGADILRGSWGVYTDLGYANGNVILAASDANGIVETTQFRVNDPAGIKKPDGSFFHVGDPIETILPLNEGGETGLFGEVVSPRLEQPFTKQASIGWTHRLGRFAFLDVNLLRADGRDLNMRARLNSRVNGGARRFADLPVDPQNFAIAISRAKSRYDGAFVSLRRRAVAGLEFSGSYTWSRSRSELGKAVDETGLGPNMILSAGDPYAPAQFGPTPVDARHRISLSAIVPLPWQMQAASVFYFRSALPVTVVEGVDRNRDGVTNDLPDRGYAFDGVDRLPLDAGPCRTVNCARGAGSTQLNVRVWKAFRPPGRSRLEVIAEVFNLFNASNPAAFNTRRLLGGGVDANPDFMQPAAFAGDFQQPEQRVGQIGLRWTF